MSSAQLHRQAARPQYHMIAGYRPVILAWHVAGSLLLRCCCYSFGNTPLVSTTSRTATTTDRLRGLARAAAVAAVQEDMGETARAKLVLPRPIVEVVLPRNRGLRVHSMSDLHTDSAANAAWCVN